MQSKTTTVEEYLAELPEDRRAAISAIRDVILRNLPKGYAERMQYGMIGYYVPHSIYPSGYHCDAKQPLPYISRASQKNNISIYLPVYQDEAILTWFRNAWQATGNKLDMGKSCVRVKKLEQVPLDVLGETVAKFSVDEFVVHYESVAKNR